MEKEYTLKYWRKGINDRYDGWRVKKVDPVFAVIPYFLRTRMDAQNFFEECLPIDHIEEFIKEHKDKYGNIPDTETFLQKFQDFELLNVQESDDFLIHTFKEEYQYAKLVPVVNRVAELLQSDSNSAVEYLKSEISNFRIEDTAIGTNIITASLS